MGGWYSAWAHSFQKRYCVLSDLSLQYLPRPVTTLFTETSGAKPPKGTVPLYRIKRAEKISPRGKWPEMSYFEVVTGGRVYHFGAGNDSIRDDWVGQINALLPEDPVNQTGVK